MVPVQPEHMVPVQPCSEYFGREDLPKVAMVMQKAYEWTFSPAATE